MLLYIFEHIYHIRGTSCKQPNKCSVGVGKKILNNYGKQSQSMCVGKS